MLWKSQCWVPGAKRPARAWPLRPGKHHAHTTIRPQRVKVSQSIGLLGHPQEAETVIVAAPGGRAAEAKRQPAAEGVAAPATAPTDAEPARGGACRIYGSTTRILPVPVLHPFLDIAIHVIESPGIGLQLPHWVRLPSCILVIPGIASQLARIIAKTPPSRRPGTCCILPLRLRRQAIHSPAFPAIEPTDELLHVVPGDVFNGPVRVARESAGIGPHHGLPLALCHLVRAQIKRFRDVHRMHWLRHLAKKS